VDGDLLSLAAELPSPLALVIAEYVEASEPYNKLHRLVDAAEVITRFLSTILLSDVADQLHAIPTDSDLGAKLASRILNPTFGHWRELAVAALGELKRHSLSAAVAELPEFWCGVWEGLLGTNKAGREDAVLPLRNHIAHLGRMTDQHAGSLLHSHQSRFEQALTKLTFLKRYDLVAISTGGEQILLRGRSRPDRPFAPYSAKVTSLSRNEVYLVGRKASLPLYPLNFKLLPSISAVIEDFVSSSLQRWHPRPVSPSTVIRSSRPSGADSRLERRPSLARANAGIQALDVDGMPRSTTMVSMTWRRLNWRAVSRPCGM